MRKFGAFLSGAISYLAFAPISIWFAPFIGFFLLYRLLRNQHLVNRLIISQLFGLGLILPNQIWTGTYVGALPWIILSILQSFLFWPFAIKAHESKPLIPVIFAGNAVIVELLLRTIPFTGFGWSRISFTQVSSPLNVIYPILGCSGVIFLIAFLASNHRIKLTSMIVLVIFSMQFLYKSPISTESIKIALVQGGVDQLGLDFNAKPRAVFNSHLQTTAANIKPSMVELIIWPENAVDIDLFANKDVEDQISTLSSNLKTPILVGGITRRDGKLKNISVLFNPGVDQTYIKRYLTPFGEYIPLRSILSRVTDLVDQVDDFTAGKKSNVVDIGNLKAQIFICYELLNDQFKNEINQDFLIVQTNNATFGDTAQLDQELQIAQVRALESGRSIAYVSTTGITSFIDRDGRIQKSYPKFKSGVLIGQIEIYKDRQINQILQFWPEIFVIFMVFLIVIWSRRSD